MVYANKMPPETGAQTERRNRVATSKEYIDFVLEQLEGIDACLLYTSIPGSTASRRCRRFGAAENRHKKKREPPDSLFLPNTVGGA